VLATYLRILSRRKSSSPRSSIPAAHHFIGAPLQNSSAYPQVSRGFIFSLSLAGRDLSFTQDQANIQSA
jgi:hypothetical protein